MLAHDQWFSPGTPASSTTKSGRHDIAEILLKVVLNTINQIKSFNKNLHFSDENEIDIDEEKKMHIELDAQIREWEKRIKGQHKNMGGVHMSSQHTVQMQKTVRTLENRLDQVS